MLDWMETEKERQYHEISQLFPLMQGDEFEQLKADIAANGLREAIWLHPDGSIIDGRNRHRTCIETGIEPHFRTWNGEGSLVSFVVSMNLHRRHLTSSQRAVIALDVLPMLEKEAKERQGQRTDLTSGKYFPEVESERPRDQVASIFQTNPRYVQDAKKLECDAPDLLEQVRIGDKTIPQAKRELGDRLGDSKMAVHFSSETDEHYTPLEIIEAALDCMEGIDLDPCSNSKEQPNVPANQHFTVEDDGLIQEWHGRVYMNPPYGRAIEQWVKKLCAEHEARRVTEAIALVPARTDTQWWVQLRDYPVCLVEGRLKFTGDNSAPFPSAVFYLGNHIDRFYYTFCHLGDIWQRIEPGMFGE